MSKSSPLAERQGRRRHRRRPRHRQGALPRARPRGGRRRDRATSTAPPPRQAAAELGNGSIGLALDVTDRPAFTAFLDEVEQRLGPIDIIVNNAGIMPIGPSTRSRRDRDPPARDQPARRHPRHPGGDAAHEPRGAGHIVNIASLAGKAAAPGLATYCATSTAWSGLSEAVRAELRGTGVEVPVVMPGFVKTELIAGPDLRMGVKRSAPEDIARGRRRRARGPALRRLRAEVARPASSRSPALRRGRSREWLGRTMGGHALLRAASARGGLRELAANSTPARRAASGRRGRCGRRAEDAAGA